LRRVRVGVEGELVLLDGAGYELLAAVVGGLILIAASEGGVVIGGRTIRGRCSCGRCGWFGCGEGDYVFWRAGGRGRLSLGVGRLRDGG
jgi:hypothetical protein